MTDILIIGGGIAGISAAARLSPYANVVLLEQEAHLGYHSSGRSAATFVKDYGNEVIRSLNVVSLDFLQSYDGGFLSPRGMLFLAKQGEEHAFSSQVVDFGLDEISMDDAMNLVPVLNERTLTRAAYSADIYDIDTDRLMNCFVKIATRNGAVIHKNSKVYAIKRDNKAWEIKTHDQVYRATVLINAAGAWADQIAQMSGVKPIGIKPYKRSIARMHAPLGVDVSKWPMMDGVNEKWYAKPDAGHLIISPADQEETFAHDAWADDEMLAEGVLRFQETITPTLTHMSANWAGLRSFAPDHSLVIGESGFASNFYWCAGQGGYGFQTCVAASQLLADLIFGQNFSLDQQTVLALSPKRFECQSD